MNWRGGANRYPCLLLIIVLLALLGFAFVGCGRVIYGDPVKRIKYENRLDEAVFMTYRYDGKDKEDEGATMVPPRSSVQEPVMIRGKGITIRGVTRSGAVVFDRHYTWDELPKGEVYTIVIE